MSDARRPLVLVADDDEDILALVGLRLERAGYDVVTAKDGIEALEAVGERAPDVAVVDVMMPRMDGHELVRRLRARPDTGSIPILVLTAAVHDRVADASADAGADAHMRKPFSPRELVARLDELLGR
ncbi:MAG: response regulator receiver protein [Solirubrobacteraceae bacterium]|nr:response regulator receiver protein [Solirubrobacteraceae bacterium]